MTQMPTAPRSDSGHTFFVERVPTPTGPMLLLTDAAVHVRALDWEDHAQRLHRLLRLHYGETASVVAAPHTSPARRALVAYFDGDLTALDAVETATGGTQFRRRVWDALRTIPAGTTWSYGQLAAAICQPTAVRAVGLANGANPIGIIVPCHRVIGANASLTGYGGGLPRKRWLLEHEGALTERLLARPAGAGSWA
jgi:methylated-DNA-[protein]-cysteine S-methyltransferase